MNRFKSIAHLTVLFLCCMTLTYSRHSLLPCAETAVLPLWPVVPVETESESPVSAEETKPLIPSKRTVTLSFLGDCLIATADGTTDRVGSLNWTADHEPATYFFQNVSHILKNDDLTVADCENVFTDSAFTPIAKEEPAFWFRSATKNASILQAGGVDMVSVANNHTGDYGQAGFEDTVTAVEKANVQVGYSNQPVILEKNGIKIGIVCEELWCYDHYHRIVSQLKAMEAETDIQVVFFHGGTEKIHEPEEWKQEAARRIVEAGADLVIGGHPHVLQPMEIYQGVPIVYSLGNFVYGGNTQPENRTIIYQACIELTDRIEVTSKIIPCTVYTGNTNNWQPAIIEDPVEKQNVLDFMKGKRDVPY